MKDWKLLIRIAYRDSRQNRAKLAMYATEYVFLGALSAATGICISLAGSFLLANFVLELPFNIQWLPIVFVFLFVVFLTVVIGLLNTREVVNKTPLEVLRKEVE